MIRRRGICGATNFSCPSLATGLKLFAVNLEWNIMNAYERDIVDLLDCSEADAVMIEYIIREEIFHSTLDWQTKAEFDRAARKAAKLLAADRQTYEEFFAATRSAYQRFKAESEDKKRTVNYET